MKRPLFLSALLFLITLVSFIALVSIILLYKTQITAFAISYPMFLPIFIVLWRALSIILAPLPGGILSFAFIPIMGWFWAWFYGAVGGIIGSTIAFYIARKFREPVVSRFIPLKKLHNLEDNISNKTEFFAFLGIRISTWPVADFVSFIAGLSKISYKKFIFITFLALLVEAGWYYFGGIAFDELLSAKSLFAGIIMILVLVVIFFTLKNHGNLKNNELG